MKNIAYYNGKTAPIEEMMVPMNDRACYFGDGVYDATIAVNHVPMHFDDHIDRIYRSAKLIDIDIPMPKAEMAIPTHWIAEEPAALNRRKATPEVWAT